MRKFQLFFMLLFLISISWILYDGFDSWSDSINLSYQWIFFALVFSLLDTFFDYLSWRLYLDKAYLHKNHVKSEINLYKNLNPAIFLASFASDLLPAKMGTFSRPFLLKSFLSIRLKDGGAVHFNALFSDFCAAALVSLTGLIYWGYATFDIFLVLLFLIMLTLFLLFLSQLPSLQGLLQRIIRPFYPADSIVGIRNLQQAIRQLFNQQTFIITFFIKILSWLCLGLCLHSMVNAFGYEIHVIESFFVVTMSSILGMISLLPGGLFVAEASLLGFLVFLNIPTDIAIFTVFIYRLFSFWLWVIVGNLVAQLYLSHHLPSNKQLT
jgi:glycosyltransferase 2 family protein